MRDFSDDDDLLEEDDEEDAVGYKHPPKQHQFKTGQSGNPKGRPKKSPTFDDLAEREGRKLVAVKTRDGVTRITKSEVLVRRVYEKAMQGDHRSAELVMRMQWRRIGEAAGADLEVEALGGDLSPESVNRMVASYLAEIEEQTKDDDDA